MDITFSRGPCSCGAEPRTYSMHPSGFPYEGKLSPEATDEVDSAA